MVRHRALWQRRRKCDYLEILRWHIYQHQPRLWLETKAPVVDGITQQYATESTLLAQQLQHPIHESCADALPLTFRAYGNGAKTKPTR